MASTQMSFGRVRSRDALRPDQLEAIADLGVFALQQRDAADLLGRALDVLVEVLAPDGVLIVEGEGSPSCVAPVNDLVSAVIPAPGDGQWGTLAAFWRPATAHPEAAARACIEAVANIVATALARIAAERAADDAQIRAAQAQEAIRLRDEFLSIASHELKTPLTSLLLQLESLLERQDELDRRVANKLARATRSANRLGDLIETLLDVSRLTTGRMRLRLEECSLDEIAADVIERLRTEADRAGCAVELAIAARPRGQWDRLRIEQVLINVLSNAFKYGAGQPVDVHVDAVDGAAELRVCDHGPGIASQDTARIFERFERAVSNANYGGLGLGLYVARQIVEAHGGAIIVETHLGYGATFIVRLPQELH